MGHDDLSEPVFHYFNEIRKTLQAIADKAGDDLSAMNVPGSKYSLYVRPMHRANCAYLLDVDTEEREASVVAVVQAFWPGRAP